MIKGKKRRKKRRGRLDMQFITSSISTTLVLILLGMVVFCVLTANNLSDYVRENINFSLVLAEPIKADQLKAFHRNLLKEPFVKEAEYISKEQALQEQTEALGTDPKDFLGYNPFSASIELKLNANYAHQDSLIKIENQLEQSKYITEVIYQKDLLNAVNENIKKITIALFVLALVLTLISFALINNTIRLGIYSQRFLIHTMKLVGASWGFIRRPFIKRNVWSGVIAALLANLVLLGSAYLLVKYNPELIEVVTPEIMLIVAGSVLVFGIFITFVCSFFSINRYLRMKESQLY
ncbi:MAG: permease-like cell division protein FtsX [Bacteroides sp.]|nr:permease-like cell division protein FtsX [Bacteroides sp.]NLI63193.1 cell division protein FtsX [Bacteroidales bacterium]